EQRNALARQRAHLMDEVRTKNAGRVFEQRNALARLRAHLRDEVRNRPGRALMDDGFVTFLSDPVPGSGWISPLIGADVVDTSGAAIAAPAYL
uniref:hypothetical protein n=1 Tax=Pantoea vagans TaxID=470934 RepID=UPI0028A0FB96